MKKRSDLATKYFFRIRDLEKKLREKDRHLKDKENEVKGLENELEKLKDQLKEKDRENNELKGMLFVPKRHDVCQKKNGAVIGKPKGSKGGNRPIPAPETITEKLGVTVKKCTECHKRLTGKNCLSHTVIIEDIPLQSTLQIREVSIFRRWCPDCKKFIAGTHRYALPGQRLGNNVLLFTMYHKYRNHLPYRKIADSLRDLYGISVSHTELLKLNRKANQLFQAEYQKIKQAIKKGKVVYADETGWRIEGEKAYVWVFDTKDAVLLEICDTRGGGVPRKILGKNPNRTVSSDFYTAYDKTTGRHQKCWSHTLSASRNLCRDYPKNKKIKALHGELKAIFSEATKFNTLDPPGNKEDVYQICLNKLESLSQWRFSQKRAKALCKRIYKYKHDMLTFVLYPEVDPTNNQAERSLRQMVLARKISGGSRSKDGARIFAQNASVIQTAIRSGKFFEQLKMLLLPN